MNCQPSISRRLLLSYIEQPSSANIINRVRSSTGITRNYGNYRYSKYVGSAPRR